jgi:hypothetical protein
VNGKEVAMTAKLKQAFERAAELPDAEQDLMAFWLLAELESETDFDRKIAQSSAKLAGLARQALADFQSGATEELDPERI